VNPRQLGIPLSNFTAYNARWKMPSEESGGVESMWYRCVGRTLCCHVMLF
jgi:exo-beta-1,3-glucanase (GH17 family)